MKQTIIVVIVLGISLFAYTTYNKNKAAEITVENKSVSVELADQKTNSQSKKEETKSIEKSSLNSKENPLFTTYIEAKAMLGRRNASEVNVYMRKYYSGDDASLTSLDTDVYIWQKQPAQFTADMDTAVDLLGFNFITADKFNAGVVKSEGDITRIQIPAENKGSKYTLFFRNINNTRYILIPY